MQPHPRTVYEQHYTYRYESMMVDGGSAFDDDGRMLSDATRWLFVEGARIRVNYPVPTFQISNS